MHFTHEWDSYRNKGECVTVLQQKGWTVFYLRSYIFISPWRFRLFEELQGRWVKLGHSCAIWSTTKKLNCSLKGKPGEMETFVEFSFAICLLFCYFDSHQRKKKRTLFNCCNIIVCILILCELPISTSISK